MSGIKILYIIAVLFIFILHPYNLFSQEKLDIVLDQLTEQINNYMFEQKKTNIAIIPFSDLQRQATTVLGSYLAEELTTNLFMTEKFKIVERNLLKQVLNELKLSQTGVVDPSSAKELGKMAGVDAIVTGTTADLGSYVAVNCRLIETETGEVFAAAKAKIRKDENIARIMEEIAEPKEEMERTQEEKKGVTEGMYNIDADEISIKRTLVIGLTKAEIKKNFIIIKLYARNTAPYSWYTSTFYLEDAYVLDNKTNKYYLKKVEGLELGTKGTSILGARVGGTSRSEKKYLKQVKSNSRIWVSLYFPRFELSSPNFLLYINGYEIEVNLILPN